MKTFKVVAALALTLGLVGMTLSADDKKDAKFTIKEVMKKAHAGKDALAKKIAAGDGSKEDKEILVELYTALAANKPPKGDEKGWKERADALLKAAKEVQEGKDGAADKLKKLIEPTACMSCHKEFKK